MVTGSEYKASDPRGVLGSDGAFAPSWLRDKSVAPLPAGVRLDAALARRITAGCRAVGAANMLASQLAGGLTETAGAEFRPTAPAPGLEVPPPFLLSTPDLQGAVLFPEPGYALIAGTAPFMAAAVGEGADTARARFGRYARTLADRHPHLPAVAAAYAPEHRAASRTDDIDPSSAAARHVTLLDALTAGTCSARDFADGWWEARRASLANGERIQGPLSDLFDRVFMILEDYAYDPEFAEPGDLDDAEVEAGVRAAWEDFRHEQADRL
ncbi:hypothetical protein AVW11_28480 [Streptomyces amritsarensis]|uniref:Colicin D immunity protein domain-containing protein n=2 Tax=Streptomyces amritsarensis TaxID=681158 RepID=A0ABX3FUZ7_9ACTN|nr:hypothetical protein AVW11_28480 [Streptomyces amritsarensis]